MTSQRLVYIGTDSGATTSKTGGVWADGSMVSMKLLQSSTNSQAGTEAVVEGLGEGRRRLPGAERPELGPGPRRRPGDPRPLPALRRARAGCQPAGRASTAGISTRTTAGRWRRPRDVRFPWWSGNDGKFGGVAEAKLVRAGKKASVLMLAPGSGLGCAYIDANGLPLDGETLAGMEAAHMPAPLHLLGMRPLPCGCGRTWGCVEAYTTLSGMPHLVEEILKRHPEHAARDVPAPREGKSHFAFAASPKRETPWQSRSSTSRRVPSGIHAATSASPSTQASSWSAAA